MALEHHLPLMSTIAAGLSGAFVFGMIASKLRIPPIVGYLLAGVMIGPYTPGFVGDVKIAEELSEIGVVLLMFGVGLHFSLRDLLSVKNIALPGAIVQIAAAVGMGAAVAHYLWDWPLQSGLMFGLSLSVASTVVLLRALDENNITQSTNGRIAVGWLIVEDLVMIIALVMIPALMSVSNDAPGGVSPVTHVATALGKVAIFIFLMAAVGKRFLPWVMEVVSRTNSREMFTLAVIATAVGLAYGAGQLFGVSFALGAFFAGMMIRESDLNHAVADRALPFQDAFAVLFFVSVGMLFNPIVLIERLPDVLLTTLIIVVGKSIAAFAIVLLFRYTLKTALIVSASLAQIGEFSFILLAMGATYGLLPPEGRDLVLAGAILSIALNPLVFALARKAHEAAGRNRRLSSMFNLEEQDLSHLRRGEKQALKDLVILVGHGIVGHHIARNILDAHIDLVIVDNNRDKAATLRRNGYHVIAGDACYPETLKEAAISKAVAVIVAIPDPFEARRIVENVRLLNPKVKILVRAHNETELDYFEQQNVDMALTGPREIALRMTSYINKLKYRK